MMKKYDNYQDSGLTGIDEIPSTWILCKLKYILSIKSGEAINSIDLSDNYDTPVYGGNGIMGYTNKLMSEDTKIIIGRVGAYCGNVHLAKGKKWVSDNALIIETDENLEFLTYVLKALQLNKLSNKNAQPLITGAMVKDQIIPFPSDKEEQTKIAQYLDHQTAIIDQLIQKKEKLLELLKEKRQAVINEAVTKGLNPNAKMKNSGIEWLGEVPEEWEVKKLKYCIASPMKYGANEAAEFDNPQWPRYIRITDFGDNGELKNETFKSLPPNLANEYLLSEGDVLFARSGATVGKTFIFNHYSGLACFAGYLIKVSVNRNKLLPEFLYYFTKSGIYENWKNSIFIQSTIQNISAEKYRNLDIPFPSITDQKEIISTLQKQLTSFDQLLRQIGLQIEKLKEYRQSIISEAVTGKIDVRDWQPNKNK